MRVPVQQGLPQLRRLFQVPARLAMAQLKLFDPRLRSLRIVQFWLPIRPGETVTFTQSVFPAEAISCIDQAGSLSESIPRAGPYGGHEELLSVVT